MADLPRYENIGVQYADLPKISTALQQVKAQGYADIGQQLDRMTNFFQEKAVTEAQKAALKYSIEFPPTKEQLDIAKQTGVMPTIKGAGSVFTETYNKASAHILGNQIQTDFQNRSATRLAAMEAGQVVDVQSFQRDLRDDIDGSMSILTALDPEASIKFRASMATVGHGVYKQALEIDEKNRQLAYAADQEAGVLNLKPVIENVIKSYTSVGMNSSELESVLQNVIQPFTNKTSITLAGSNKYAIEAYKIVNEAKVGAVLAKLSDPEFALTPGAAAQKLIKGDLGEMTGIYKSLDEDTKRKVRTEQIKAVSEVKSLTEAANAEAKAANKVKGNELQIEFLNPKTSSNRKREIAFELISLDEITLTTAQDLLKPKEAETNPLLEANLYEQIKRGSIKNVEQLTPFSSKLSRSQFTSLARSLVDESHRNAKDILKNEAGLTGMQVNPSQEKIKKAQDLDAKFELELQSKIKDPITGVLRFQTPDEAAKSAVSLHNNDKNIIKKEKNRKEAETSVNRFFAERPKIKKPNTSLDETDFSKVPGLSEKEINDLNQHKKLFKDNL